MLAAIISHVPWLLLVGRITSAKQQETGSPNKVYSENMLFNCVASSYLHACWLAAVALIVF